MRGDLGSALVILLVIVASQFVLRGKLARILGVIALVMIALHVIALLIPG